MLSLGCSDDPVPTPKGPGEMAATDAALFDFGPVLARGQTLRHEFTLTNPSGRPLKVLVVEALTPCCSTVESAPATIPPGGSARLAVTLNPGFRSGRKRARFAYRTDDDPSTVRELTLVAELFPEVDDALDEGSDATVPLRRAGRQSIRFAFFEKDREGRGEPDSVEATPPLSARFVGPAEARSLGAGIVRTTRVVEVGLPAEDGPGGRRGRVTLHWPDGKSWERAIEWNVVPRIVAHPPALTLRPGQGATFKVVLKAEDRPFRVRRIDGPILPDKFLAPGEPSRTQVLEIPLDPAKVSKAGVVDLAIETDHPDQARVVVSVLILPATSEDRP